MKTRNAISTLLLCTVLAACAAAGYRPIPGPQTSQAVEELSGGGRGSDGGGGGSGGM